MRALIPALSLVVVVGGCGSGQQADDDIAVDALASRVVEDLNDYWVEADAELGFDYEPIRMDRVSTGRDGVLCDGLELDPAELEGNAFVDADCAEGLLVAYDPDYLDGSVVRTEGTLAHEWGHVVQAQAREIDLGEDPDGLPIDAELQADCLAGAWAAERATADVDALRRDVGQAADPAEVELDDPDAHGTAEERVSAFEIGLSGGPAACIDQLLDALPG